MTKKHGTTSQVDGSYVEFQAAILRALPRDIDLDVLLGWMRNGKALARVLKEVFMSADMPADNTYPLSVDYRKSVEDAVRSGLYDRADSDITTHNFPTKWKGTAKIRVELIQFNWWFSTDRILQELNRMGYRPAELHELLAFAEKYPDIQRAFPIVSLGSIWKDERGNRNPYLDSCAVGRTLGLHWDNDNWHNEDYRFAAIRKSA